VPPSQGSGGGLIKLAMIHIDREVEQRGLAIRMLLQVHDELLPESPPEELDTVRRLAKSAMENIHPLDCRWCRGRRRGQPARRQAARSP
jgi:DNA polymerase-1